MKKRIQLTECQLINLIESVVKDEINERLGDACAGAVYDLYDKNKEWIKFENLNDEIAKKIFDELEWKEQWNGLLRGTATIEVEQAMPDGNTAWASIDAVAIVNPQTNRLLKRPKVELVYSGINDKDKEKAYKENSYLFVDTDSVAETVEDFVNDYLQAKELGLSI